MSEHLLSQQAYEMIKHQIITIQIKPGSLISENELAEQLKMSRTPIRKATARLESEGFIETIKNRGMYVKLFTEQDMRHMTETILSFLFYSILLHRKTSVEYNYNKLKAILDMQIKAEENDNYLDYIQAHLQFQRAIISITQNEVFLQVFDQLTDKIVLTTYNRYLNTPYLKHYSANQFNKQLLEALMKQDIEEAQTLILKMGSLYQMNVKI